MSARKLGSINSLHEQVTMEGRKARLELSVESVSVHKNGIEFRSPTPFKEWTEMTMAISSRAQTAAMQRSRHRLFRQTHRYRVSMIFAQLKQAQARLIDAVTRIRPRAEQADFQSELQPSNECSGVNFLTPSSAFSNLFL